MSMMNLKTSDRRHEVCDWRDMFSRCVGGILRDARKNQHMGDLLEEGYVHVKGNLSFACVNDIPPGRYLEYIELLLPLAYKRGEWQESILDLEKALSKKKDKGDMLVTLDWLSRLHEWLGQYSKSEEYAVKGLQRARQFRDKLLCFEFLLRLGKIRRSRGDYHDALELYKEAEALIADDVAHRDRLAYVLVSMGLTYWHSNSYDQALSCYEKALVLCEETGNTGKMGHALNNMGLVYTEIGMYKKALELLEQALAAAVKLKDRREIALTKGNIGMVYFYLGEYDTAVDYISDALKNAEQLKSKYRTAKAKAQLSLIHRLRSNNWEDLEKAARYALEAYQIGTDADIIHFRILGASYLAASRYKQGRTAEAIELSSEAVRLLDQQTAFDGLEEEIYFTHSLILGSRNKEEFLRFLEKSFDCLQKKISQTSIPEFRNSLARNVKLNRLILSQYRKHFRS
jgi:tetratricopeptide (TPR) repeat protein